MIELLGLVFGGAFRLLPEILKLFNARDDRRHELEMTRLQLEVDKARAVQAIDLAHTLAEIAADAGEMQARAEAIRAQAVPSGVPWIDALSSSVRPVLTYWWCLVLYTAAKVVAIVVAYQASADLRAFSAILFTEFDRMVVGSIFSFWFVDRSLRKGKAP